MNRMTSRSVGGDPSAGDGNPLLFSVVDVGGVSGLGVRSAAGASSGSKRDGTVSRGALTCRVGNPPRGMISRVRVPVATEKGDCQFFHLLILRFCLGTLQRPLWVIMVSRLLPRVVVGADAFASTSAPGFDCVTHFAP